MCFASTPDLPPVPAQTPRLPDEGVRLARSDELVGEVKAADTLVIGLPIYNFGLPAALKASV